MIMAIQLSLDALSRIMPSVSFRLSLVSMAKIHILGICGTFMGGIARIASSMGHEVSGSDRNTYPPMSTQLESLGIALFEGFKPENIADDTELVIIGNALSRGNTAVEYVLNKGIAYISGPQWLSEAVLQHKWVLAISGTHGKTTTTSMLAWILEFCGYEPGYLIGGVASNFEHSARITDSPFFVIEADEYDSAFFDKRSKMIHYRPKTLSINNLEFDHADIFSDLGAIQTQFHHLVRTVPEIGRIIYADGDIAVSEVLTKGCWSELESFGTKGDWECQLLNDDGSHFRVSHKGYNVDCEINWDLIGQHNVANATVAIACAMHVGVKPLQAAEALQQFKGVKRRLEIRGKVADVTLYDDFAHHPTAIKTTLNALRAKVADKRVVALVELRSNTMKMGFHKEKLMASLQQADVVGLLFPASISWKLPEEFISTDTFYQAENVENLLQNIIPEIKNGDHVVIMSNGSFEGIHQRLITALENEWQK